MFKPVRVAAGLGDPPREHTNNYPEEAGPYEIRPEFQHLAVKDQQWSMLSSEEKKHKLRKFRESRMGEKRAIEKSDSAIEESVSASVDMLLPDSIYEQCYHGAKTNFKCDVRQS